MRFRVRRCCSKCGMWEVLNHRGHVQTRWHTWQQALNYANKLAQGVGQIA